MTGGEARLDLSAMLAVVTDPQTTTVGLSNAEAKPKLWVSKRTAAP